MRKARQEWSPVGSLFANRPLRRPPAYCCEGDALSVGDGSGVARGWAEPRERACDQLASLRVEEDPVLAVTLILRDCARPPVVAVRQLLVRLVRGPVDV